MSNEGDVTTYTHKVIRCDNNILNLNVEETKEMIVDFVKSQKNVFANKHQGGQC